MKLPVNTAPVDRSSKTLQPFNPGGVTPSINWMCLLKCVGGAAAKCIPKCGADLKCYAECAPHSVTCVMGCL